MLSIEDAAVTAEGATEPGPPVAEDGTTKPLNGEAGQATEQQQEQKPVGGDKPGEEPAQPAADQGELGGSS